MFTLSSGHCTRRVRFSAMVATRSSSRLAPASEPPAAAVTSSLKPASSKRKSAAPESNGKKKVKTEGAALPPRVVPLAAPGEQEVMIPAKLSFSFDEAKRHLVSVDPRFQDLFEKRKCTPFEVLEQVHPFRFVHLCRVLSLSYRCDLLFRSLATSIMSVIASSTCSSLFRI